MKTKMEYQDKDKFLEDLAQLPGADELENNFPHDCLNPIFILHGKGVLLKSELKNNVRVIFALECSICGKVEEFAERKEKL